MVANWKDLESKIIVGQLVIAFHFHVKKEIPHDDQIPFYLAQNYKSSVEISEAAMVDE